jgi:DNA-binding SARP family transcriptional activator/TolB-like protein
MRLTGRKARALLGYLAISEAHEETRDRLVGLLWSEVPEENARASLRQVVHEIREAFRAAGADGFTVGKRVVALDPAQCRSDLAEVIAAADAGRPHPLLFERPRLAEELLGELETVDPAFRIWLLAKRQAIADRLQRGLEISMRDEGDPQLREPAAAALLQLDPTNEEACRLLISLRAGRGDFGGALRLYKTLWDLLETEFDVEPSEMTQELVVGIRNSMTLVDRHAAFRAPPREEPAAVDLPPATALAARPAPTPGIVLVVAPFDIAGTAPDQRYLAQGFRHELIATLVRFREWQVRDGPAATGGEIGQYVIEASAFTADDAMRLVLTLRDAPTGIYVWSDRYQLTLASWFEAQLAIIRRIAVALNVQLSANRLARFAGEADIALDAYDRWLRAQAMVLSFDPAEWTRAGDMFRATIREAPTFSPAYSSLVQINNSIHFVYPGIYRTEARERETLELARTAVQLDPIDCRAQLSMGWAHAMARNYGPAELHMAMAVELNENDPWSVMSAALFHAFAGLPARARALAAHAMQTTRSPTPTHWVYESTIAFVLGDDETCIASSLRSGDTIQTNIAWRAAALAHLGRIDEARSTMDSFLDLLRTRWAGPAPPDVASMLGWFLHLYPIRHEADWDRLRRGLAAAGAPVGDRHFDDWRSWRQTQRVIV